VLTSPQPQRRRPRQSHSLKQEYEEFILQRIEEFKDQISREDLLAIADEAVRELEMGAEEQLVLTEVLLLEHVDRLIIRRLRLPTYRRWRDRHVRLRSAQKQPTHWGLDPATPLAKLVEGVELRLPVTCTVESVATAAVTTGAGSGTDQGATSIPSSPRWRRPRRARQPSQSLPGFRRWW